MVQTQSQGKCSGIKLPEVHGVGKGFRSTYTAGETKNNKFKPIVSKAKEVSQIKPGLEQRRTGLRCKINTQISNPIVQTVEKPLKIPDIPKT